MLVHRFSTGAALIAALVAVLALDEWFAPAYPLWFAASFLALASASAEFCGLLGRLSARPTNCVVFGGVFAILVSNWIPHVNGPGGHGGSPVAPYLASGPLEAVHVLAWPCWAFAAIVMIAFVVQSSRYSGKGESTAELAATLLAIAYLGILGSFTIQLRWLGPPGARVLPLAMMLVAAKGTDIGAYSIGRLFGRNKLWERLSPKKTIEGSIGGAAFGILGAVAATAIASWARVPCLSWTATIVFGVIVSIAAQFGDLMESMIKRDCESKDSSAVLPGFGGVLDVLDSLLFAGPVAYAAWIVLGP